MFSYLHLGEERVGVPQRGETSASRTARGASRCSELPTPGAGQGDPGAAGERCKARRGTTEPVRGEATAKRRAAGAAETSG